MRRVRVVKEATVAWLRPPCRDESGATLVEYALLLLFVVVAAVAALVFLGGADAVPINNVAGHIGNAA